MANGKIVAVIGATGAQGGGLVQAMLADKARTFTPRAITRNPKSERARALADAGVEVVQGDADQPDSLPGAFAGAHGAFLVTNFWEHLSPERELAQAHAMADGAKAAGLQHVVWSTLEDTRKLVPLSDDRMPTLGGKYKVPHFDAKGEADQYFRQLGVPTTFLITSFYWDNLIHFGMGPRRGEDGHLVFALPMGMAKLTGIAAEDIGKAAYGILTKGSAMIGKTVGIAGEHLTGDEMARALGDAMGQPVRYSSIPFDVYRGLGFPGADDLGNMFQVYHDFGDEIRRARSLEFSREVNPELQTFKQWLGRNKERIPVQ